MSLKGAPTINVTSITCIFYVSSQALSTKQLTCNKTSNSNQVASQTHDICPIHKQWINTTIAHMRQSILLSIDLAIHLCTWLLKVLIGFIVQLFAENLAIQISILFIDALTTGKSNASVINTSLNHDQTGLHVMPWPNTRTPYTIWYLEFQSNKHSYLLTYQLMLAVIFKSLMACNEKWVKWMNWITNFVWVSKNVQ